MNFKYIMLLIWFLLNSPLAVALDNKTSEISDILSSIQTEQGYPGISLAISFGDNSYSDQIGYADTSEAIALDSETIFRSYSLTKGLTEILSRILVRNKMLDLSSPISTYIPNLPIHIRQITGQQLLSHRSGIRHYHSNEEWLSLSMRDCDSPADILESFINDPLVVEVGKEKHYSSFGYVLLSNVIESAAGKSFVNLMSNYVLDPSGTQRTEFDNPKKLHENVTKFYEPSNGEYLEAPDINNSCKFGGGGINSTPTEIAQIFSVYFSGKLTKETSSQVSGSLPKRLNLSGEGLGGRSALVAYPNENLTVVIMANARGGNLQPYAAKIAELILADNDFK